MNNPFLQKPSWILLYMAWWILPGSIHLFVLWNTYQVSAPSLYFDALISFTLLAILSLSIWYLVRFSSLDSKQWQSTLHNHIVALFLIFILWIFMSYGILNLLFTDYNLLFKKTIVWRALLFLPSYLMVLSMYFLLSSMQKVKDQQLQQSQMQAMIKEAEFNALKAQINPHFLFNSLNAATSLTLSDPQKARDMIINIADFFRFSLLSGKKPFWTLSDELEHALLYLEIERGRFADKLIVVSDLPIEMKDLMLPTLLLQPLVENAVKHGVYESSKPIHIHFTFENRIDYYSISIGNEINNQAGTPKKGTQTGLQNVASRLEIAYGSKQLISSQKTENQFIVKVSIPKKLSHATTESRNH